MDNLTPEAFETKAADALDASFDIVSRQDANDAAIEALRHELTEVKGRIDKAGRAALRPVLAGGELAAEVKSAETQGFIDGYLRLGRETELKSLSIGSAADGGFAVPRQIDSEISRRLVKLSPVRGVSTVVRTSTSGFRRLIRSEEHTSELQSH